MHISLSRLAIYQDAIPKSKNIVLIGTIDKSPVIDRLIKEGKIDVDGIRGSGKHS